MTLLLHGDCLEHLQSIEPNSVDLIFCDLPYGQTSCKWDCPIDLDIFWTEVMRIKKLNTPIIMTTTTKFGVSLIQSAPKSCPFRYDLVWCKSASCGFLSAKKQPLRKHEMLYVFYEKLPFYDLSSHKHKFIDKEEAKDCDTAYGKTKIKPPKTAGSRYDPPLPDSLIKEDVKSNNIYHNHKITHYKERKGGESMYEPPLPNSLIKENGCYGEKVSNQEAKYGQKCATQYEPKLPTSLIKEGQTLGDQGNECYGKFSYYNNGVMGYEPKLPTSLLEVKSTRGKHSTEKPVDLMKWILKYYSKEGDVILDPTMGSGSMGVACLDMKRNFIGIEKDDEIFNIAYERIN